MPLRSQPASTPVQVPTSLTVSAVAKSLTVSSSSAAHNPTSPAMLQGVSSQNIKQVNPIVCLFSFVCFFKLRFLIVRLRSLELHDASLLVCSRLSV